MRRLLSLIVVVLVLGPGAALAQPREPEGGAADQVILSGDAVVPRGRVVGEVVVFHGSATVSGVATGNVVVIDGPVVVGGQVGGDVIAIDGEVRLLGTAQVGGDVIAGGRVIRDDGSSVGGDVRSDATLRFTTPVTVLGALLASAAIAVSVLITAALLIWLAPRGAERVADAARNAPLAAAGWGLALTVLVPALAVASAVTVLGLPLGLALLLGLGLLWIAGQALATWIVGRLIVREPRSRVGALFVGWAIGSAIGLVPFLNVVWWSFGSIFGLGAATVAIWRARGKGRHRLGGVAPPPEPPVATESSF